MVVAESLRALCETMLPEVWQSGAVMVVHDKLDTMLIQNGAPEAEQGSDDGERSNARYTP